LRRRTGAGDAGDLAFEILNALNRRGRLRRRGEDKARKRSIVTNATNSRPSAAI
jgi:hypothetical protein